MAPVERKEADPDGANDGSQDGGDGGSAASFRATALLVAAVSRFVPQLLDSDVMDQLPAKVQARLAVAPEPYVVVEDIFLIASNRSRLPLRLAIVDFLNSIPELERTFAQATEVWGSKGGERDVLLRLAHLGLRYQNPELDRVLAPIKDAICTNDEDRFPRCLEGTRDSIIENVLNTLLASSPPAQPLILTGGAGTGKSAIASSLVYTLKKRQVPVCSFICAHDMVTRRKAKNILRTLARQLCRNLRTRAAIEAVLAGLDELEGGALSVAQQFDLLLGPKEPPTDLKHQPTVLVVDALDECDDDNGLKRFLQGLSTHMSTLCRLYRIVIVTRRTNPLNEQLLPRCDVAMDLDEHLASSETSHAISAFITHSLDEIRERQMASEDWPSEAQVEALNVRAAGIFVWVQVAMRFIDGDDYEGLLEDVLSDHDDTEVLFALFNRTLLRALTGNDPNIGPRKKQRWLETYTAVFGAVLFTGAPCTVVSIAYLSTVPLQQTKRHLESLRPLLRPFADDQPVQLLHASIARFLQDPQAADFRLDSVAQHRSLAWRTLEILHDGRRFNLADVDATVAFKSAQNFEVVRARIFEHEEYSVLHWVTHVKAAPHDLSPDLLGCIIKFFDESFLHWLEIFAIVGTVLEARNALAGLLSVVRSLRLSRSSTSELQNLDGQTLDATRLLSYCEDGVSFSPAQIYLSGLPFARRFSDLARHYLAKLPAEALPRVIRTGDARWPEESLVLTDRQSFFNAGFADNGSSVWTVTSEGATYRSLDNRQVFRTVERNPFVAEELSRFAAFRKREAGPATVPFFISPLRDDSDSNWRAYRLPEATTHVAVSGDGSKLALAGSFGRGWLDLQSDAAFDRPWIIKLFSNSAGDNDVSPAYLALALSYDGSSIAWVIDGQLHIRETDGSRTWMTSADRFRVNALTFTGKDNALVLGCSDHRLRICTAFDDPDLDRSQLVGHTAAVTAVAASRHDFIASSSDDGEIRLWSRTDASCQRILRKVSLVVERLVLSDDGTKLLAQSADPAVCVWDLSEERDGPTEATEATPTSLADIAIAPDGSRAALIHSDGSVGVHSCGEQKLGGPEREDRIGDVGSQLDVQWSADSSAFVVWTSAGAFARKGFENRTDAAEHQTALRNAAFCFADDLERIVATGVLSTKHVCVTFRGGTQIAVDQCGDGSVAAISGDGMTVACSVEDPTNPTVPFAVELRPFDGSTSPVRFAITAAALALALSNDGGLLCVAGAMGHVDLFDSRTGRHTQLGMVDYTTALPQSIRLTDSASKVVIRCTDGSIALLDFASVCDATVTGPVIAESEPGWIRPACSKGPPIWLPADCQRHRGMLFDLDSGHLTTAFAGRHGPVTLIKTRSADPWEDFCQQLRSRETLARPQAVFEKKIALHPSAFTYPLLPLKNGFFGFNQSFRASSAKHAASSDQTVLARPGYAVSLYRRASVQADDHRAKGVLWFLTEPFTQEMADAMISFRLNTLGKDQGWADNPQAGAWSWYTIRILDPDGEERQRWRLTSNKFLSTTYQSTTADMVDVRGHLASGDRIEVAVNAAFGGWRCDALAGGLHTWVKAEADSVLIRIAGEDKLPSWAGSVIQPRHFAADFSPAQPRFWGLPASPVPDAAEQDGEGELTHAIDLNHGCRTVARTSEVSKKLWFRCDAFDERTASHALKIRLRTSSRDQGHVDDASGAGSFSWFTIAVLDGEGSVKREWESHRNPIASQDWTELRGPTIDLNGQVTVGDYLAVYAVAQFPAWVCEGRWAELAMWTRKGWRT